MWPLLLIIYLSKCSILYIFLMADSWSCISSTQTDQPISSERKRGIEIESQRGRGSQLERAVQQMRDDIPTQNKKKEANDGRGRKRERERVTKEQRHLVHKGFLMEQNLHNLLRWTDKRKQQRQMNNKHPICSPEQVKNPAHKVPSGFLPSLLYCTTSLSTPPFFFLSYLVINKNAFMCWRKSKQQNKKLFSDFD